jgi:hypothetical protein
VYFSLSWERLVQKHHSRRRRPCQDKKIPHDMTLKVTIFGVVHAHHVRWGVPKGLMENVVVDLGE